MEYRIKLTKDEAISLANRLEFLSSGFIKDEYTGKKRIRTDEGGTTEKKYITPIKGLIFRFSSKCRLGEIKDIWFEYKWTDRKSRFEVEFEGEILNEFKNRKNIPGWNILE